jgi:hypothetical protein
MPTRRLATHTAIDPGHREEQLSKASRQLHHERENGTSIN